MYQTVTKLLGLRFNETGKVYEVKCKWRGFSDEDPTWEPLAVMREGIPEMLNKFLDSYPDPDLVHAARSS